MKTWEREYIHPHDHNYMVIDTMVEDEKGNSHMIRTKNVRVNLFICPHCKNAAWMRGYHDYH